MKVLALVLLGVCSWVSAIPVERSCICQTINAPVCAGGKTYGNLCQARCDKVTKFTPGACPSVQHHGDDQKVRRTGPHHTANNGGVNHNPHFVITHHGSGDGVIYHGNGNGKSVVRRGNGNGVVHHDNGNGYGVEHHGNGNGYGVEHHGNGNGYGVEHHGNGNGYGVEHHGNGNGYGVEHHAEGECDICPTNYDPVCGPGWETFPNECSACQSEVFETIPGACEQVSHFSPAVVSVNLAGHDCKCPRNYDVVCGADRQNYANRCLARCNHVTRTIPGECQNNEAPEADCLCPSYNDPVCGADGETYPNACLATCSGVTRVIPGGCFQVTHHLNGDCWCPRSAYPVCGASGRTHVSACVAECAGEDEVTDGACPEVDPYFME